MINPALNITRDNIYQYRGRAWKKGLTNEKREDKYAKT
jgi:hypothetical protein